MIFVEQSLMEKPDFITADTETNYYRVFFSFIALNIGSMSVCQANKQHKSLSANMQVNDFTWHVRAVCWLLLFKISKQHLEIWES